MIQEMDSGFYRSTLAIKASTPQPDIGKCQARSIVIGIASCGRRIAHE